MFHQWIILRLPNLVPQNNDHIFKGLPVCTDDDGGMHVLLKELLSDRKHFTGQHNNWSGSISNLIIWNIKIMS